MYIASHQTSRNIDLSKYHTKKILDTGKHPRVAGKSISKFHNPEIKILHIDEFTEY